MNTLSFKRVRLSTMMDFVRGNQILNLNNIRLEQGSPATNIVADRYLDAWTTTNPNGKYPRINFTPGTIGSDITSDLLEDGSFVRLRNVTLDYPLPDRLMSRFGVSMTRVYVTASNWKTWTQLQRLQPGREQPRTRQRQPRHRRRRVSAGEERHVRRQPFLLSARITTHA